jgi:PKD repeat protein
MKKILLAFGALCTAVTVNAQCQADFGYTNSANVFTFSDSSTTSSGTISAWLWQFGDNTAPSTTQNPQHAYEACGYYEVTLSIFTSSFCSSSYSDTIFVSQGTQPSFTFTVDTTNGDVNFQGAPFSSTLDYSWDFGDGNFGTGQNPVHTYDSSGTYVACLSVSDTGGYCTYMICDTVVVYIAPPSCHVAWNNAAFGNGQETFNATPIDFNWTYTWDFGDATAPGNGFVTAHQYAASGTYTVCLTVVDSSNGCSSMFCDTVNVTLQTNCPVTFTNTFLLGNMTFTPTPLNPLNTYTWNFGDASATATGLIQNHTYAAPGTYTVCVVMVTFQGCTDSFCDTVNVPPTIGYAEYSGGIVAVNIYPNPAGEILSVNYTLTTPSDVAFEIVDVSGRVIFARNEENVQAGVQRADISLSDLASGSYLLRIHSATGEANLPFVKE